MYRLSPALAPAMPRTPPPRLAGMLWWSVRRISSTERSTPLPSRPGLGIYGLKYWFAKCLKAKDFENIFLHKSSFIYLIGSRSGSNYSPPASLNSHPLAGEKQNTIGTKNCQIRAFYWKINFPITILWVCYDFFKGRIFI